MTRWLKQTAAPSGWPVTLAEARAQLRIDDGDASMDAELTSLIAAATAHVEGTGGHATMLGQALLTQSFEWRIHRFPLDQRAMIHLPMPPLRSLDYVRYVDDAGALQTVDPSVYAVEDGVRPAALRLAYSQSWPSPRYEPYAVHIGFTAGYGAASAVPADIKHAIKMIVGHWSINREAASAGRLDEISFGVAALLASHRIRGFGGVCEWETFE